MIVRRLAAMALASMISANAWADLRTFDIEPQHQNEVFEALTDVLTPDPQRGLIMDAHGRVELLPSGQILVNASPETLQQVEQVLQAIRAASATVAPRVSLRYWALMGMTAQSPDAGGAPGTPVPAALNDVLSELGRRFHGELTFRVLGSAALVTQSGQPGDVNGNTLQVKQTAYVQGNVLNAEIQMELAGNAPPPLVGRTDLGHLTVRATLQRGEFVVLGEGQSQSGALEGSIFYIVHWAE